MDQEVRKSYNPFKMWGFWIGFIIFFILSIRPCGIIAPNLVGSGDCVAWDNVDMGVITLLVPAFVLGILGWGMHSLFRLFKK